MKTLTSSRIDSIDLLRGLIMVIMALDHVRDFFHYGALFSDPTDLTTTTPILFFTRFITHFCAPIFIFLAGSSAYLYGEKKTKISLSKFLFTRGLWLIFLEIFIMAFIWSFDISYSVFFLQVIWAIGICMIVLSGLIHLPKNIILIFAFLLIFGHNLFDGIIFNGTDSKSIIWYILHQDYGIKIFNSKFIFFKYPIIPWVAVMALGYCFGSLYNKNFKIDLRKKYLLYLGLTSIILFFIIRSINVYGDLFPWATQKNFVFTIMSFINVSKYPPSLDYLLITIGPALILLFLFEKFNFKWKNFFLVFGRVPFFYYILHLFFIHFFALLILFLRGENWRLMILGSNAFSNPTMANYGYSLWIVYLVWVCMILFLYPICKWYMYYKANNKSKWWLSYL